MYLFAVGVGRDVAEADAGERAEGEVEGGDVLGGEGGAARVGAVVVLVGLVGELVEPGDRDAARGVGAPLRVADGVPDAGEPVGDEREQADEEEEDGGAVLAVAVQFAGHAHQAQQARRLEQAHLVLEAALGY